MKVEIKVMPEAKEPYAVIYASEITPEIRRTSGTARNKKLRCDLCDGKRAHHRASPR